MPLVIDRRTENQWLDEWETALRNLPWAKRHDRWDYLKGVMPAFFMHRLARHFEPNELVHGTKVPTSPPKKQLTLKTMFQKKK